MIEFKCRHCSTKYSVRDSLAGRRAECKTCGQRFTVPYTSPVVRLGDADLAEDRPEALGIEGPSPDPVPTALPRSPLRRPRRVVERMPPLVPLPPMVSDLWLPVAISVVCFGWAAYVAIDYVVQSPGRLGGLTLIAFAVASLLVIALRLTVRTLEGAAHTFDLEFSNAMVLQTIACVSVPVLGGVLGVVNGGVAGTVLGVVIGTLLCLPMMVVLLQMPALKGLQTSALALMAFVIGYVCSAVIVGAVAQVLFAVWSVDLPWKTHAEAVMVASATPPATQPIAPAVVAPPAVIETPPPPPAEAKKDDRPPAKPLTAVPAPQPMATTLPPSAPTPTMAARPEPPPLPRASQTSAPPPAPPLLRLAVGHLMAGSYADAIAAAKAAQDELPKPSGKLTDPRWIDSLHIQAVAFMRLGQPAKAAPTLQRLVDAGTTNRSIVLNHALCDILQQNPMRAVKNLKAFAASHPDDETAVTLWGVALDTAARRMKFVRLDDQLIDYQRADAVLERTHPGQHHWGTRWIGVGEWQSIEARRTAATNRANEAKRTLRDANTRLANAEKDLRQTKVIAVGRSFTDDELRTRTYRQRDAAARVDTCTAAVSRAKAEVDDAEASMPKPTWDTDLQPIDPELAGS